MRGRRRKRVRGREGGREEEGERRRKRVGEGERGQEEESGKRSVRERG